MLQHGTMDIDCGNIPIIIHPLQNVHIKHINRVVKLPIYYYVNETTRNSIFSFTDKLEFGISLVIIFGLTVMLYT